jgi:hypothetical protein
MSVKRNEFIQHLAAHQCYLHRLAANMTYIRIPSLKRKQQFPAIRNWKDFFAMPFANN